MEKLLRPILILLVLFSGCGYNNIGFKSPEEQFVYIEGHMEIFICHKGTNICLSAGSGKGKASGVLIAHNKQLDKSYYLTAAHVCAIEMEAPSNLFDTKVEQEIHIYNHAGANNIATVIAIDKKYDICLLESDKVPYIPAVLANKTPQRHTRIINIAAPAGLWSKKTMLHFFGEFQGNFKGPHDEYEEEVAIYTIAAQKGSSGSPVYDPQSGKLIGIITMVIVPSYDIAVGPTLEQINSFIKTYLPS